MPILQKGKLRHRASLYLVPKQMSGRAGMKISGFPGFLPNLSPVSPVTTSIPAASLFCGKEDN